jgi:hypothetical protein
LIVAGFGLGLSPAQAHIAGMTDTYDVIFKAEKVSQDLISTGSIASRTA